MRTVGLILSLLVGVTAAVSGQESIQECSSIADDGSRLACYDNAVSTQEDAPSLPSQGEETGAWLTKEETNPMDDTRTVIAMLPSESGTNSYGRAIALALRCKSGETEVYINWGEYLGSDRQRVTIRLDDAEPVSSRWSQSSDNVATFFPNDDEYFVKQLAVSKRLVAQTQPYNESPITAVFDLTGVENVVVPIRDTCQF